MAMSHLVRSGHMPQRVAAIVYGNWMLFPLITDNNKSLLKGQPDNTLPVGSILYIPEPPALTVEMKHTVEEGDTWMSLSESYYESISFFRKLESENNYVMLNKNIGSIVIIKALVSKKVFENARRLLSV